VRFDQENRSAPSELIEFHRIDAAELDQNALKISTICHYFSTAFPTQWQQQAGGISGFASHTL
jgi:hypothetical protein